MKFWTGVLVVFMVAVLLAESAPLKRRRKNENLKKKSKAALESEMADKFLERFGYLEKLPGDHQHSNKARVEAIKAFQRMYHLKQSGLLDAETRRKMAAPRCGMPDMIPGGEMPDDVMMEPGSVRANNYYTPGLKWPKKQLTWKTLSYSNDLPYGIQRRAFHNAFALWSKVAPLKFNEIGGGKADIEIKFGHGYHGDSPGNEFDGQGGILAHAYYPEDGRTHFDEAEHWTDGVNEGTNLYIVAAHEFGHALGLGHTNAQGALMAPFYQGYDPNFKLHPDDISGIQSLYGTRVQPTIPPTPQPTPRPTPRPTQQPTHTPRVTPKPEYPVTTTEPPQEEEPDSCRVKFNAVYQGGDGRIYVINGQWIWRLDYWRAEPGYPQKTNTLFEDPPSNVDAAVHSWRTRYTYLFKGDKVFKYYGVQKVERLTMTDPQYPHTPDSAVMGRDGVIYLLKGEYYYIFDEYKMEVTASKLQKISDKWPGIPANMEAAVALRDGYTYFFKGVGYRKFDEYYRRVVHGYPKYKAGPWMGPRCGGSYIPK